MFFRKRKDSPVNSRRFSGLWALVLCLGLTFSLPASAQRRNLDISVPKPGIQPLTVKNFDTTLDSEKLPVLVQFHAEWCSYCKIMQPYLDDLQVKKAGAIDFYSVDSDQSPEIVVAYNVRVLPTLMIFYKGKLIDRADGAASPDQMVKWVNAVEDDIKKLPPNFPG
jgi:thioredoxin 1